MKQIRNKYKRFLSDEKGSFGTIAATTMLAAILAVGVTVDVSRAYKAQNQVQTLTDSVALAASVYIRDNEEPPTDRNQGFVDGVKYDVSEIAVGNPVPGLTGDFTVSYDDEKRQAVVNFKGALQTAFLSAFRKEAINMTETSTVKYLGLETPPLSVMLVVDNSGSMNYDDRPITTSTAFTQEERGRNSFRNDVLNIRNGNLNNLTHFDRDDFASTTFNRRIDGLRRTVIDFNNDLQELVDDAEADDLPRFLRTAFIPYSSRGNSRTSFSSSIVRGLEQDPEWGKFVQTNIDNMVPAGGTSSADPLSRAEFNLSLEEDFHEDENNNDNVGKYVIFMTDGVSNDISQSLAVCNRLNEAGVQVYTIGYALQPGTYYVGFNYGRWARRNGVWVRDILNTIEQDQSLSADANRFLRSCASSPEHFIEADNTAALARAFSTISEKIKADAIRIIG